MEEKHDEKLLSAEMWRKNEDYLYGVDLYNFAYWWEAHEAWEGLWHQAEDTYRLFLQGLIQVSASLIKYHMRMLRPLRTLSTAGRDKLRQVLLECNHANPTGKYCDLLVQVTAVGNDMGENCMGPSYMGLNLPAFLDTADAFFAPFFSDSVTEETYQQPTVKPLIRLEF